MIYLFIKDLLPSFNYLTLILFKSFNMNLNELLKYQKKKKKKKKKKIPLNNYYILYLYLYTCIIKV